MLPMPRPPPILTNPIRRMGKKAVAGTEAMTWATGWTILASLGLRPMETPTGMVQAAEMRRAALTRRKVAPAPSRSRARSAQVTVESMRAAWLAPQPMTQRAATAKAQKAAEGRLRGPSSSRGWTMRQAAVLDMRR